MEKPGNFLMCVAFDLVQLKNGPVTVGKHLQRARKRYAIERTPESIIVSTVFTFCERNGILVTGVVQRNLAWHLSPKMHKGCRHSDTVQPSGQSRFSAKRRELSEHLNENILGQIIRLCGVFGHAKDYCIYPVFVEVKQRGECVPVPIHGFSYKTKI